MTKKLTLLTLMMIILSLFIYGCNVDTEDILPSTITLEDSIKEIITSKGNNYDFLSDELFIKKVNELGLSNNFTAGNLDDDRIPELVVFVERNPNDTNDQGKLEVYKFTGEKYNLLDSVSMNFDNTNYLMNIGKISQTQNGIFLSNQVGANAGVNYGYVLENGKLKSILNDKKIPLISIFTENEIKDIDNDGILEFSIFTIDPETIEQSSKGSDKLILWYKWDKKDSGTLIQVIRVPGEATPNLMSLNAENKQLELSEVDFFQYLKEYMAEYDKFELTELIKKHIDSLNSSLYNRGLEVEALFSKYQGGNNFDHLEKKYGLSIDRLNDLEYLKREKALQSEQDLKEYLIKYIGMGYKLDSSEGTYYFVVDYQEFIDNFKEFITKEYKDYLNIKAKGTNEPFLRDAALVISREKLAERIVEIENFRRTYPYSNFLDEINDLYEHYVLTFIYGSDNTPNYDAANKFSDGSIAVFNNTINKYPDTHFSDILQKLVNNLTLTLNVLTDDTKEYLSKIIR